MKKIFELVAAHGLRIEIKAGFELEEIWIRVINVDDNLNCEMLIKPFELVNPDELFIGVVTKMIDRVLI